MGQSFQVFVFLLANYLCVCVFLGLALRHMEVPRLGVQWELQLLATATATATTTQDPSHVCNLHDSLRQRRIFNQEIFNQSKARDRTHNLMVTSRVG